VAPGHRKQVRDPLTGPVAGITNVALPDGRTLLATGSNDGRVRLWDRPRVANRETAYASSRM
jgi:WD40 repeat protein